MQKRIKKSLGVFFIVSVLMALFMISASAKTVVSGDFKFDVGSKSATLLEYTGKDKTVKIPSKIKGVTVTKIADEAFWSKKTMTSVTIPSGVTSIGEAAFNECTGLTKIVLPSKLKTLGESAFWYCKNLKSVVIPESVTKIGKNAFKGCSSSLTAYVVDGSYGETYIEKQDNIKLGYRYASSLKLSDTSLKIPMGDTETLKVTLKPSVLYNKKVTYKSSNTKVAKVSSSGKITPVACGTAKITVTAQDGSGKKATCTVEIVPDGVGTIKQTKAEKTSVTLKWSKSDGSYKHTVFRYDSKNKEWIKVTDTTATEYTVKSLSLASTTRFRIRGYKKVDGKTYCGAYSYIYASTLVSAKVKNLDAEVLSDTEIKLTWDKATNASGYKIYSYNSENKKYTYIGKTTSLSYTVKSLKTDTEYSYSVKSYIASGGKTANCEDYSSVITARTHLAKVTGLTATEVLYSKLTLSWRAVEPAEGYEILLSSDMGTQTLKAEATSIEITDIEPDTEYTVKVRAYKTSTDNYGEYSEAVKAKTLDIPQDADTAMEAFNSALTQTREYKGKTTVFVNSEQSILSATPEEGFTDITTAFAHRVANTYYFDDGITADGVSLDSIISENSTAITVEDVLEGSVECSENGSGYEVSFILKADDKGDTSGAVAILPDWQGVTGENIGASVTGCTYTGTKITAKLQNGKISYILAEIPFRADITLGETAGTVVGEKTDSIMFIYR